MQTIQQLNFGYHSDQDRVLFKAGFGDMQEIQLWLTYRMARQLFNLLNGEAHLPSAQISPAQNPSEAVAEFEQQVKSAETLQNMDFTSEYQPRTPALAQQDLLVTQVETGKEGDQMALDLTCSNGVNVRLNLTHELILAICNMLQLTAKEAQWPLAPTQATQTSASIVVAETTSKQVLH